MQRFLPFLPDGDAAGPGGEALAVIEDDITYLLTVAAEELWAVARTDPSLSLLIATFLQFARRPFDEGFDQQSASELSVWQRMLPLLHRLVCAEERGAPPKSDRAAVLSQLIDFPRLLDICSLYGVASSPPPPSRSAAKSSGSSQLAQVVTGAMDLLPRLGSQAAQAAPIIAQNLGQVAEACLTATSKAAREPGMLQSLQDGVSYLRDTCLTLASLAQAHPPAAALLMQQGPELIEALGAVHDQLLPAVHKLMRTAGSGGSSAELLLLLRRTCHVELASERLAQQLLLHAYIQPAAGASGGSAAGSSSAGASGGSAVARGEQLLHALMLLGHREEESAGSSGRPTAGSLSLGQALTQRFGLGGSISAALLSGSLSLDDAQADYVAALLGVASLEEAPGPPVPGGSGSGGSGRAGALAAGKKEQAPAADMEALKAQIRQVKDLLPDYGDGFVAACLQQLGGSAERVLNALLEGSLPAQVASLDTQLSLEAWRAGADRGGGREGKGKQAAGAAGRYDADFPATLPGGFAGASSAGPGSAATGAAGAAAASSKVQSSTARYLDVRDESYREALLTTANAVQWEYDDEYDDSFEDLVKFGAAGATEIEEEAAGLLAPALGGPAVSRRGAQPAGAAAAQQGPGSAARPQSAAGGAGARPPQQQQQQQQQQRRPQAKGSKLWVLDGRIYNYAKQGAQEVSSREEADALLAAAQQAAQEILGLGPGGNKPWRAAEPQPLEEEPPHDAAAEAPGPSGGRGGGGRGVGGGRGRGRGHVSRSKLEHRFKDEHKAAIGNHHRKERAAAKAGRGLW